MMKIRRSEANGLVIFALSGRIDGSDVPELHRLLEAEAQAEGVHMTLDMEEVRLVDREAVKFLAVWQARGIKLKNCPSYIREWIEAMHRDAAPAAERIQSWFWPAHQEQAQEQGNGYLALETLEQALCSLRDEVTSGCPCRIFVTGKPKALTPAIREQIYLIGREALINAMRHSKATSIEAEIEYLPRQLRMVVRDNGCGIDPQSVRSRPDADGGLPGMRERAESMGAQLRIRSRPGAGTEVEVSVPVDKFLER
jgi:hypothetical protein